MDYQAPGMQVEKPGRLLWWLAGAVLLIVALLAAGVYQGLLGARLAPGLKFAVTGPKVLEPGKPAVITWDLSPTHAERNRFEKIEYCSGKLLKQKCVVLAASAGNTGKAVVQVPPSLPAGTGFIKLTARDNSGGALLARLSSTSGTVTVKPLSVAEKAAEEDTGAGSGGGSQSVSTPAPATTLVPVESTLPTPTSSPESSSSPEPSPSLDPSASPSDTPIPTPTATAEPTPTPTATAEPTPTPEPTATPTITPTVTPTPTAAPTSLPPASASFVAPEDAEDLGAGELLDIRAQLTNATASSLVCQEWLLDGVPLRVDQWLGGQAPLNVPAC